MVAQMLTQGTADGFPSLSLDLAQVVLFFLIYKGVFPSQGCQAFTLRRSSDCWGCLWIIVGSLLYSGPSL